MNLQSTLHGETITLSPLQGTAFERLYQAASDPLIWKLHPNSDRYLRPAFQTYFQGAIDSGTAFIALNKKTDEVIGCSRYYDISPETKSIKIGYTFLIRKYWGGKTNFKMKKLMIQHAFKEFETVVFEVGETNLRSRKALEKIGAVYSHNFYRDGGPHCLYTIEKSKRNQFTEN